SISARTFSRRARASFLCSRAASRSARPTCRPSRRKSSARSPRPFPRTRRRPGPGGWAGRRWAKVPRNGLEPAPTTAADPGRPRGEPEGDTAQLVEDGRKRLGMLESLLQQRRVLCESLDIAPPPPDMEPARQELARRHASLSEPYRRRAASALVADIRSLHD